MEEACKKYEALFKKLQSFSSSNSNLLLSAIFPSSQLDHLQLASGHVSFCFSDPLASSSDGFNGCIFCHLEIGEFMAFSLLLC